MFSSLSISGFFSKVQEAHWYAEFLKPVVAEVEPQSSVLDIGTGSGKLLQMLAVQKQATCFGTDTNPGMIRAAGKKLNGFNIKIKLVKPGSFLPFHAQQFDCITICNVLFNLDSKQANQLVYDSVRLLKPGGKLVVLTPSGNGNFKKLYKQFLPDLNPSVFLWFQATRSKGLAWNHKNLCYDLSQIYHLNYEKKEVFDGLGTLEIMSK